MLYQLFWYLIIYEIFEELSRVRSHAPSIQSHRGTKVVWPDFSQWASQKNRFALIYFGKIQFLPPCIWNLPFMSSASVRYVEKSVCSAVPYNVHVTSAWIFKQSMWARNRVGIGLSYRPARLHSLAELVPWNRFLGSLKLKNSGSGMFCSKEGNDLAIISLQV
jgi:hypothetical protein